MPTPVPVYPLASPWGRFHLYSYLIDAPELAIVDTGITTSPVEGMQPALEALGRRIEDVRWILLTHGHIDHMGGAHALWELTGRTAEVVIGAADAPLLRSRQAHVDLYFDVRDRYLDNPNARDEQIAAANFAISGEFEPTRTVLGGEQLDLGGVQLNVHAIPGHTAGSVAYEIAGQGDVFVGDAAQIHGAANGFPGYEDPLAYRNSLEFLANELDISRLFLGHPYRRSDGTPYGVELDRDQARAALAESIEIEQRISDTARSVFESIGFVPSDSPYSPFAAVAERLGYTGDPRLEPSPFFTTLDGYQRLLNAGVGR